MLNQSRKPRILLLDVETAPMLGYVWSLWQNDVALNQLHTDWHLLSWSAKWYGEDLVMYMDQRDAKNVEDDKELVKGMWALMDQADVLVTHNGKKFDEKKLNARFVFHKLKPPSSYKHVDTLQIAKSKFAFTSNKLEYIAKKLGLKYKKLEHKEFPGFELWTACLAGDRRAWREMELYNRHDVLTLEALYERLRPWSPGISAHLYNGKDRECECGGFFKKNGFAYTKSQVYIRYKCTSCGMEKKGPKP